MLREHRHQLVGKKHRALAAVLLALHLTRHRELTPLEVRVTDLHGRGLAEWKTGERAEPDERTEWLVGLPEQSAYPASGRDRHSRLSPSTTRERRLGSGPSRSPGLTLHHAVQLGRRCPSVNRPGRERRLPLPANLRHGLDPLLDVGASQRAEPLAAAVMTEVECDARQGIVPIPRNRGDTQSIWHVLRKTDTEGTSAFCQRVYQVGPLRGTGQA